MKRPLAYITAAWCGNVNSVPAKAYISVRPERYSYNLIKESGEFVLNLPTEKLLKAADWCGVRSGRDQFLRLAIPFDAFYMHIGRSGITQTYIDQNEYRDRDVDGNSYNFIINISNKSNFIFIKNPVHFHLFHFFNCNRAGNIISQYKIQICLD